nr:uncharacterized protein LOC123494368 [Aegilops tauschii subsp. strangulata]
MYASPPHAQILAPPVDECGRKRGWRLVASLHANASKISGSVIPPITTAEAPSKQRSSRQIAPTAPLDIVGDTIASVFTKRLLGDRSRERSIPTARSASLSSSFPYLENPTRPLSIPFSLSPCRFPSWPAAPPSQQRPIRRDAVAARAPARSAANRARRRGRTSAREVSGDYGEAPRPHGQQRPIRRGAAAARAPRGPGAAAANSARRRLSGGRTSSCLGSNCGRASPPASTSFPAPSASPPRMSRSELQQTHNTELSPG